MLQIKQEHAEALFSDLTHRKKSVALAIRRPDNWHLQSHKNWTLDNTKRSTTIQSQTNLKVNSMPDTQDDHAALLELNRNYVRAAEESDVEWFNQNLDADFVAVNPDGSIVGREAFLTRIAGPHPGHHMQAVDVRIRLIGDLGLIHAGFKFNNRSDNRARTGCYTDTWLHRNGRWLCIAAHFTVFP